MMTRKKAKKVSSEFYTSFYEFKAGGARHRTSGKVNEDDFKRGHYAFKESFTPLIEMIEKLSVPLGTKVKMTLEVE